MLSNDPMIELFRIATEMERSLKPSDMITGSILVDLLIDVKIQLKTLKEEVTFLETQRMLLRRDLDMYKTLGPDYAIK